MTKTFAFCAAACAAVVLTACGGGSNGNSASSSQVAVENLASGSYVVAVGSESAPTIGKYYAAADGSRLLVLADSSDRASQLYRKTGTAEWLAVPAATGPVTVTLLRSTAQSSNSATLASLAGRYAAQVASGMAASFTLDANGNITAGTSSCKLSGTLAAGTLPNTFKLSLNTSGCGTLPATSTGVATLDADYTPAKFRMVADNGTQLLDLWAYAD